MALQRLKTSLHLHNPNLAAYIYCTTVHAYSQGHDAGAINAKTFFFSVYFHAPKIAHKL